MKHIYINYWIACLAFVTLFSCNNDDDQILFSETPAERIAQRNSELVNSLVSQEQGFKVVYYTKNDQFGGFTYFMKFNADGTVIMTSDFDSETPIISSSYEVRFGTTTELVFTTRNHIQKVSETSAGDTDGFRGTSVFQYLGNDNGVITFRDVRNRDTAQITFEPSGLSNFEVESVLSVEKSLAQRSKLLPNSESSVFQVQLLRIENSNGVSNFNFNYNPATLFARPRLNLASGPSTQFNFGILFTETGLIINPGVEFQGETYTNFTYNDADSSFISTVNGTTAKIMFEAVPIVVTNDIDEIKDLDGGNPRFLYRPSLGANPLTSVGHDAIIENINNALSPSGISFFDYTLFFDFDDQGQICESRLRLRFRGSGDLNYCFSAVTVNADKTFVMAFQGPSDQDSADLQPIAQELIDMFNGASGLISTLEGPFRSDTRSFTNTSATFTSLDSLNLRVYGVFF